MICFIPYHAPIKQKEREAGSSMYYSIKYCIYHVKNTTTCIIYSRKGSSNLYTLYSLSSGTCVPKTLVTSPSLRRRDSPPPSQSGHDEEKKVRPSAHPSPEKRLPKKKDHQSVSNSSSSCMYNLVVYRATLYQRCVLCRVERLPSHTKTSNPGSKNPQRRHLPPPPRADPYHTPLR